jgi:hypothetical protein
MTTNNEESRPRRTFNSANNERHASSNRNYGNERRTQQEGYHSSERSYNQNYGESPSGNSYGNSDSGMRKRRPRVGERVAPQQRGPGGNYGNRSWGNQPQNATNQPARGGQKN